MLSASLIWRLRKTYLSVIKCVALVPEVYSGWSYSFKSSRRYKFIYHGNCILGLETSCDDTGVALISLDSVVLQERVFSQTDLSTKLGGVLPTVACELHSQNLRLITTSVLKDAGASWKDIDSIAVTVRPGMPLSLKVGVMFAKQLAGLHARPVIPIHHMEAHAVTTMLTYPSLTFPFLVLLLSGGHGLLALARGLEDFLLLGMSLDAAPGDVLDKLARRLKLSRLNHNHSHGVSGGHAIELWASGIAEARDPELFHLPLPRSCDRDCDFSFTGIHLAAEQLIRRLETDEMGDISNTTTGTIPPHLLITVCASIQLAFMRLISQRVQRAFEFLRLAQSTPGFSWPTALVVSGGVAANSFIRAGLSRVASHYDLPLLAPPARLCTDNGVMVAWNGLLLRRAGSRIVTDPGSVDFEPSAPFGIDCRSLVRQANIKVQPIELTDVATASMRSHTGTVT